MKIAWKQVVIAFLIGAVLGLAARPGCLPLPGPGSCLKGPQAHHERMMEMFSSKLGLSPEQRQKVGEIMEDTRAKMDALRREGRPKFEAIRAEAQAKIRALLDEGQKAKFEQLERRLEEKMKKRGKQPRFPM